MSTEQTFRDGLTAAIFKAHIGKKMDSDPNPLLTTHGGNTSTDLPSTNQALRKAGKPPPFKRWHNRASKNRKSLRTTKIAGCFYCGEMYPPTVITTWVDGASTALCPKCGIDSVLPMGGDIPCELSTLRYMYDHWFRWATTVLKYGKEIEEDQLKETPRLW